MSEESESCSTLSDLLVNKTTTPVLQKQNNANTTNTMNTQVSIPEESINNILGFPIYLLIIITILTNLFIAIILTPVLSIGVFIIIFLIVIVSVLLLYIISEIL
jgi:hypothetical protein